MNADNGDNGDNENTKFVLFSIECICCWPMNSKMMISSLYLCNSLDLEQNKYSTGTK